MTHEITQHTNGLHHGHHPGQPLARYPGGPPNRFALSLSDFDDTTPMTIEAGGLQLSLTVRDVLEWIAPGAPAPEALKFLVKCRMFGLNPLADEIYLLPMGPKWQTLIAKSGYLNLANEQPTYGGFEAGIIVQKVINAAKGEFGETKEIEGACVPKGWIVIGGWCRAYRTDRARPVYVAVGTEYYKGGSNAWKDNSPTMYRKVAISQAHREAFPLGGAYDEDEFEGVTATPALQRQATQVQPSQVRAAQVQASSVRSLPQSDPIIEAEIVEVEATETIESTTAPPTYNWPASEGERVHPDTLAALTKLIDEAQLDEIEIAGMLERRNVHTGRLSDLSEMGAQDCLARLGAELVPFPWETGGAAEAVESETAESETAETNAPTVGAEPTPDPETNPKPIETNEADSFIAGGAVKPEPRPRGPKKPKNTPAEMPA